MRPSFFLVTFPLFALAACGSGPDVVERTADLSGTWEYTYGTRAIQSCPPPAPPDFTAGCGGAGEAVLDHEGDLLGGTIAMHGYCQSCTFVADSFGNAWPVSGQVRGGRLEFTTAFSCRHSGTVGFGEVSELTGSVSCTVGGLSTQGTWRMTRKR